MSESDTTDENSKIPPADWAKAIFADIKKLGANRDIPDTVARAFTGTIIKYLDETGVMSKIDNIDMAARICAVCSTCFYSGYTIGVQSMIETFKKKEKK